MSCSYILLLLPALDLNVAALSKSKSTSKSRIKPNTNSAYVISVPALRGQAARARLHQLSARNLRNTGRLLERIQACSGRSFRRLVLRSRGRYPAARPARLRQFSRPPAVAAL